MEAFWLDTQQSLQSNELEKHGIPYQFVAIQNENFDQEIKIVMDKYGYIERDEVSLSPQTPNLENLLEKFKDEHSHDEDEVRLILEGEGIFDIRSNDDQWIRVEVHPGDLIIVPEKRFHRFMLTSKHTVRCVRLFKDKSGWVPTYRN